MEKSLFNFELPQELIAQQPLQQRDSSRLLVLNKSTGAIQHYVFSEIINFLNPGDCLILNDTRVLPARLYGVAKDTGARVEFLLLKQVEEKTWEALAGPGRKAKPGRIFIFGDGTFKGEVLSVNSDGNRIIKFFYEGNFFEILDKTGEMPLPHYITEKLNEKERYQTVYSKDLGSAVAPTAGLHFTPELLKRIESKGVKIGFVTLHVGLGTFRPVKSENIEDHKMHSEFFRIPSSTAQLVNSTKMQGSKVVAVGTTCCRVLESTMRKYGNIQACEDNTDIFIYPGFKFECVDALITNFHLPESTLIMLVCAFGGYENAMNAYKIAVEEKYRFFSFGDSMFVF